MQRLHTVPAAVLAVLLLACLVAVYVTRDFGDRPAMPANGPATGQSTAVDPQLLKTANEMAALAETGDEQNTAREALRLADHELDQAFATALRQAAAYRPPLPAGRLVFSADAWIS